ncbi:MAG TPA: hypothetical protein VKA85_01985 [Candidatus Limnocylindrales bacterium]|nr:hypothetical protein [Candidatus Limnocylindrales bacterium]
MPTLPGAAAVTIDVACTPTTDGWTCRVRLTEDGTSTHHEVSVKRRDLARLAPAATEPDDLVRRSFDFLLAREPKESILRSFDLTAIARYFPEWERAIRDA